MHVQKTRSRVIQQCLSGLLLLMFTSFSWAAQHNLKIDIGGGNTTELIVEGITKPSGLFLDQQNMDYLNPTSIHVENPGELKKRDYAEIYTHLITGFDSPIHLLDANAYTVDIEGYHYKFPWKEEGDVNYDNLRDHEERYRYWFEALSLAITGSNLRRSLDSDPRSYRERMSVLLGEAGYENDNVWDQFAALVDDVYHSRPIKASKKSYEILGIINDLRDLKGKPEILFGDAVEQLFNNINDPKFKSGVHKISNGLNVLQRTMDALGPIASYANLAQSTIDYERVRKEYNAAEMLFSTLLKRQEIKHYFDELEKLGINSEAAGDPAFKDALNDIKAGIASTESLQLNLHVWTNELEALGVDTVLNGVNFMSAVSAVGLKYIVAKSPYIKNVKHVLQVGKSANFLVAGFLLSADTIYKSYNFKNNVEHFFYTQALLFDLVWELENRRYFYEKALVNKFESGDPIEQDKLISFSYTRRLMYASAYSDIENGLSTMDPELGLIGDGVKMFYDIFDSIDSIFSGKETVEEKRDAYAEWAPTKLDKYLAAYETQNYLTLYPNSSLLKLVTLEETIVETKAIAALSLSTKKAHVGQTISIDTSRSQCINALDMSFEVFVRPPFSFFSPVTPVSDSYSYVPTEPGVYAVQSVIDCDGAKDKVSTLFSVSPLVRGGYDLELNSYTSSSSFKPGATIRTDFSIKNNGKHVTDARVTAILDGNGIYQEYGPFELGRIAPHGSIRFFNDLVSFDIPDNIKEGNYSIQYVVSSDEVDETPDDNIRGRSYRYGKKVKVVENVYQFQELSYKWKSNLYQPKNKCDFYHKGGFGSYDLNYWYNGKEYDTSVALAATSGWDKAYICVETDGRVRGTDIDVARFFDKKAVLVVPDYYWKKGDTYYFNVGWPVEISEAEIYPTEAEIMVGEIQTFKVDLGAKGKCCVNKDWYVWEEGTYPFDQGEGDQFRGELDFDGTIKEYGYELEIKGLKAGDYRFVTEMANEDDENFYVFGRIKVAAPPTDSDSDGVPDEVDAFPFDRAASIDQDGDSFPDTWNDNMSESDSETGLRLDHFPQSVAYALDSDDDNVPDELDAYPYDPNEFSDSDGDGIGDNADPMPTYPGEFVDTDGDGIGNELDNDDDNDFMPDSWEEENGLNPLVKDDSLDGDNDLLTNLQEYILGTNPHSADEEVWTDATANYQIAKTPYSLNRLTRALSSQLSISDMGGNFLGVIKVFVDSSIPLLSPFDGYKGEEGYFVLRQPNPFSEAGDKYKTLDLQFVLQRAPMYEVRVEAVNLP